MSDQEFPTADDLLKSWNQTPAPDEKPAPPRLPDAEEPRKLGLRTPDGVDIPTTSEQAKAIGMILSGLPFVAIAIKPTGETGADFYTAIQGNHEALRAAKDHLQGVIDRAFVRRGIV